MQVKDIEKLKSPSFVISLVLLLLNDFWLKSSYPCWITGKLSDFSGLFVFPIFWAVFFPQYKKMIFFCTAVLFIIWNSTLIQPILDFLHSHQIWIDRTVDYSDNIALISVFFAYRFIQIKESKKLKLNPIYISLVSLFAFTATTLTPRDRVIYMHDKQYEFDFSIDTLCNRLNFLCDQSLVDFNGQLEVDSSGFLLINNYSKDTVYQKIDLQTIALSDTIDLISNCSKISVWGNSSKSSLLLKETIWYKRIDRERDFSKKSERDFRIKVINELKKKNL